jgi:hypothetical protein
MLTLHFYYDFMPKRSAPFCERHALPKQMIYDSYIKKIKKEKTQLFGWDCYQGASTSSVSVSLIQISGEFLILTRKYH